MKPATPEVHVVGAAIVEGATCLAVRRSPSMSTPDKWEFPGGKVEEGESPQAALRREIQEELGLEIEVGELLGRGSVAQENHTIHLDIYLAKRTTPTTPGQRQPVHLEDPIVLSEHSDQRWLTAETLYEVDWAPADIPVLPLLRSWLETSRSKADPGSEERVSADPGAAHF